MNPLIFVIIGLVIMGAMMIPTAKRLEKSDVPYVEPVLDIPKISSRTISEGDRVAYIESLYQLYGYRNDIDPMLIKAIAIAESNENSNDYNPEDPSYGIMQILCVPDGKGGCENRLNVVGWPPTYAEFLYDPEYNISIGAQILAWNTKTYGYRKGIAIYNAWGARKAPPGGPFINQKYVNKVVGIHNQLRPGYGAGGEY